MNGNNGVPVQILALTLFSILFLTGENQSMSQETTTEFTNHLAGQTSPYLLQHQHNPVDWYPWGEEALKKAREEDKPIFLSIGYSACHWCHVMEHESFENPDVAKILNDNFVSIKVDREERPDLDEIYMTATQLITGSGGWPMSVFLTPDLKPFYAGTYFPPEDRYGRPGFKRLISALAEAYRTRRDEVERNSENVTDYISRYLQSDTSAATVPADIVRKVVDEMKQRFDPEWGGFGGAPKFPHTMDLMLMLRDYRDTGDEETLKMVEISLQKMARGGMYDQLGGGFHRYSVDAHWLIPHFEKMLYDNALLARTYLEAFQVTGNPFYSKIAKETLDYVIREMQSPEGGYYSSTDADSEGEEGKYFVWTPQEIKDALGEETGRQVCTYFGVTESGNFENGKSVLWVPKEPAEVAGKLGLSSEDLSKTIEEARTRLFEKRSKRVPPALDDKTLTDWNGLMISSMAFGGFVLSEPRYIESARKAAEVVLTHQWDGNRLLHTRRNGESHLEGTLSDYSHLVMGLLDLYKATRESRWLKAAVEIHKAMVDRFEDKTNGGFFNTPAEKKDLLIRTKTATDNAVPSGNSIAALNSLRIAAFTGETEYEKKGEKTILAFGSALTSSGGAYPMMMNAVHYLFHGGETLVLVPVTENGSETFLEPLRKLFAPCLEWIETSEKLEKLSLIAQGKQPIEDKSTAYLCNAKTCEPPVVDPGKIPPRIK